MLIVKLDATDSTNQYLKELALSKNLDDFTVVSTDNQLKGKGQMGAIWQSEPGMNLTFSILKNFKTLSVKDQFLLNIYVSLSISKVLKSLSVPNLSIKWPNDILSGSSKICGILVENILLGNQITASIIGIGLNVNQLNFNILSNVSSLKLLLGQTLNLDELLQSILKDLKYTFLQRDEKRDRKLWNDYEQQLFRKNKPSTFKDNKGDIFMGFIRGISPEGKLIVELEDAIFKEYGLKEIQLQY